MDTREFLDKAIKHICSYMNVGNKAGRTIVGQDVYIVWCNKAANNNKGIFAVKGTDYLIEVTSIDYSEVFYLDYYLKSDKEVY